jgi:hypothetical protein
MYKYSLSYFDEMRLLEEGLFSYIAEASQKSFKLSRIVSIEIGKVSGSPRSYIPLETVVLVLVRGGAPRVSFRDTLVCTRTINFSTQYLLILQLQ